jgi:hypothetical protein
VNNTFAPIDQCDVVNKDALVAYRSKAAKWHRWLRTDAHHAIWKQIYAMLLSDLTYRTLSAAAQADRESALHSPILSRGLIAGYAAAQGLAIRRLVGNDPNVISLRRLVMDIKNSREVLTREIYVAGSGLPYDLNEGLPQALVTGAPATGRMLCWPSIQAHATFDMLCGKRSDSRSRDDRIPQTLFARLADWLSDSDVKAAVDWSNDLVAHSADQELNSHLDFLSLRPTMGTVASAQRRLIRVAEVVSAHILSGAIHDTLVPFLQYSQFTKLDRAFSNKLVINAAGQRWRELAKERDDEWTSGVLEELTGRPLPTW